LGSLLWIKAYLKGEQYLQKQSIDTVVYDITRVLITAKKNKKKLGEYLDTLDTKNLDLFTWTPAEKWN